MSCFSRGVSRVGNTQIFARLTGKGTQYLVYQMDYVAEEPTAVILPLPVASPGEEKCVYFMNLKGYNTFFSDLSDGFPAIHLPTRGENTPANKKLAKQRVGDYFASFVPSVDDFEKLDPEFAISKETWAKIPNYRDYSFAVFQLAELKGKPSPIALEFETRMPDKVFFPTLQIHDGKFHRQKFYKHELYLQHASLDSRVGEYISGNYADGSTGLIRSKDAAGEFCQCDDSRGIVMPGLLVHRVDMVGPLANGDVLMPMEGDPVVRPVDFRPVKAMAPWGAVLGGVSWLIYRRNLRRREKQQGA